MDLVACLLRRLLWLLHRRRRGLAPPYAPFDLLCLLARAMRRLLLPPPAQQPAQEAETSTVLAALFSAGLRRIPRGPAPPVAPPGESHPLLLTMAADAGARRLLLRLALDRIRAGPLPAPVDAAGLPDPLHAEPVPAPPDAGSAREQFERILFGALIHWARRLAPLPTDAFALRLLLRLPARQSRRLLPPIPGTRARSTILGVMFYIALCRFGSSLRHEKDRVLLDFVSLLRPLSLRLLPSGSEDAHADIPRPPARLRLLPLTPTAADDDAVHLLLSHALAKFSVRPAARVAPTPALIAIRLALDRELYVLIIHILAVMKMMEMRAAAAARAAAKEDKPAGGEVQVVVLARVDDAREFLRRWDGSQPMVVDVPLDLPSEEALEIDCHLTGSGASPSQLPRGPVLSHIVE